MSSHVEYVEYLNLTTIAREAVHAWVRAHGINPADVPLDGIRFDTETDEYVITVANRDAGGSKYVGDDGELSTREERRPAEPLLPWPTKEGAA